MSRPRLSVPSTCAAVPPRPHGGARRWREARLEGIVRGERGGERAREDDEAQQDAADRHGEMAAAEPRRRREVERTVRHEYRMRGSMTV